MQSEGQLTKTYSVDNLASRSYQTGSEEGIVKQSIVVDIIEGTQTNLFGTGQPACGLAALSKDTEGDMAGNLYFSPKSKNTIF